MNLPNKLTLLRIFLIPVFVAVFYLTIIPYNLIISAVVFALAAFTDFLDGYIARKYKLVNDLGKFLDPIADKILTAATLFMIIADGTIPHPWGAIIVTIIIAREFMVSALRLLAASKGTVLAADIWGKAKTMVQMIALPICILLAYIYTCGFAVAGWLVLTIEIVSYVTLGAATILTIVSGANYMIKNIDCFKENK